MPWSLKCFLSVRHSDYNFNAFIVSLMRVSCPAHLVLPHFIALIKSVKFCKLKSASLRNLRQSLVISYLLYSNILLRTTFSNTLNRCSFLRTTNQVSHTYETRKCSFVYFDLYVITWEKER
jgi:hypothetical protein